MSSIFLLGLVPPWVTSWLTPVWLLSLGFAAGAICLLLLWGVTLALSRRAARAVGEALLDGILFPISIVVAGFILFALIGAGAVQEPGKLLASVARIPMVGSTTQVYSIPAPSAAEDASGAPLAVASDTPIDVRFRRNEIRKLVFDSDQDLQVRAQANQDAFSVALRFDATAGKESVWQRFGNEESPFTEDVITKLYVRNMGTGPARLTLTYVTRPEVAEVEIVLPTMLSVVGFYLVYFLMLALLPKISAVAISTSKSAMAQPLFPLVVVCGMGALLVAMVLPYFTFGDDIKMLKDTGMDLLKVIGIGLAIWLGSTSVADEIEGRTALTVLSKPIGRRQFLLGKFFGIVWVLALLFILLGLFFLVQIPYKVIYDARESAAERPEWFVCFFEMHRTVPGLVLIFLETVIMAAISVAISTRLSLIPNFVICGLIYALGHLTPVLVNASAGHFEPVVFVGQLIAVILPVLDHFNIQGAISTGRGVPADYLAVSLIYCIVYCTAVMMLALALFEDRDLA